ncbi:MAG TPA: 2OG-Fe(II) oxygenase [Novosphingobium sp.]|nr:2OG-Fe(II) oxygenase [Novosphingobium sp.]
MAVRDPRVAQALAQLSEGRKPEALLALNQLGAAGNGEALRILGELRWGGRVDPDPAAGRALFERADDAGDATAAIYTTNLLASGIAGPRDWARALERLRGEAKRDPARRSALEIVERMALDDVGDPLALRPGERVSEQPDIVRHERLFTAAECAYVLAVAEAGYAPSTVYDSQRRLVRDPLRSSDGSTLHWLIEDPAIHALNRRLAAACGTDAGQGEAAQVLRYKGGQEYRPHFDFVRAAPNQRVLTALVWLGHDYKGGETVFPKAALKLRGRKGDAVVFRNALPDGTVDPLTEHAGLPVTVGTKFLYSRWIREARWAP